MESPINNAYTIGSKLTYCRLELVDIWNFNFCYILRVNLGGFEKVVESGSPSVLVCFSSALYQTIHDVVTFISKPLHVGNMHHFAQHVRIYSVISFPD